MSCVSVATVLTVYGIETEGSYGLHNQIPKSVATVLTVYGIETADVKACEETLKGCNSTYRLRY